MRQQRKSSIAPAASIVVAMSGMTWNDEAHPFAQSLHQQILIAYF